MEAAGWWEPESTSAEVSFHFGWSLLLLDFGSLSVIFVNENENENGEKRENNEFVNEN